MRVRVAVCLACLAWAELLRPTPGGAQQSTGDLAGRVVDANDRPVPDARVIIVGLVATITDSAGGFAFTGLESETLLLRVEKLGYGLATRTIVFWADSAQREVVIRLGTRSTVLAAVTVLDSAADDPRNYARRRQNGQGFFLTQEEIRKRGSPASASTLDALRASCTR